MLTLFIKKDYKIYVTLCQKTHSNPSDLYSNDRFNDRFVLNPGYYYKQYGKAKADKGNGDGRVQGYNREVISLFRFVESGEIVGKRGKVPIEPLKPEREKRSVEEIIRIFKKNM